MVKDFEQNKIIISEDRLRPGAQVMMLGKSRTSKWDPVYKGPFTVFRKNSGGTYALRDELGLLKHSVPPHHLTLVTRDGENATFEESETIELKEIKEHHSEKNGKMVYFVVWKDYSIEPCWVPVGDFDDLQVIRQYRKSVPPTLRLKKRKDKFAPRRGRCLAEPIFKTF